MRYIPRSIQFFLNDEDGPAATEYAIMLALIVVVCIGAIAPIGLRTRDLCNAICMVLGGTPAVP